jgi:hypothetical protein
VALLPINLDYDYDSKERREPGKPSKKILALAILTLLVVAIRYSMDQEDFNRLEPPEQLQIAVRYWYPEHFREQPTIKLQNFDEHFKDYKLSRYYRYPPLINIEDVCLYSYPRSIILTTKEAITNNSTLQKVRTLTREVVLARVKAKACQKHEVKPADASTWISNHSTFFERHRNIEKNSFALSRDYIAAFSPIFSTTQETHLDFALRSTPARGKTPILNVQIIEASTGQILKQDNVNVGTATTYRIKLADLKNKKIFLRLKLNGYVFDKESKEHQKVDVRLIL